MNSGDVLIAISASGNSSNIVKAAEEAHKKGGIVIGLVGFDGGILAQISDYVISVPTEHGEYGPVEDLHLFIDHMISAYVGLTLTKEDGVKRNIV
jgi:D-sedoheptulose 7-phosphate isomerase